MSVSIDICPKHGLRRKLVFGRNRCMVCKREAGERYRQKAEEQMRIAAETRVQQKAEAEELDRRVQQIWREKFAAVERACGWDERRLALPRYRAVREEIARRAA